MRKLLVCAALVWLGAALCVGQEDGAAAGDSYAGAAPAFVRLGDAAAESARLLKSKENRERAWGAYLAGLHGLREHAPLLVALLEDPSVVAGGPEESHVRQAALDGLIRLGADVPAETLLSLYGPMPDEVIILLAREPQRNREALLTLFNDEAQADHWLAVGNLLAETRASGFAARLLAGLKMKVSVYVYDREGDRGYGIGCGGGCGGGCAVFTHKPEGFPPVFYYSLTTNVARDAVVVAPGRHAVYYVRTLAARGCGVAGCGIVKDRHRVEYLAGLLGATEEDLKLAAGYFREIVCEDAWGCRRALVAVRDEIEGHYASVVARLLGANLLDPAEAAELKPDLTLYVRDARDRKMFPLPDRLRGMKIISSASDEPPVDSVEPSPGEPR